MLCSCSRTFRFRNFYLVECTTSRDCPVARPICDIGVCIEGRSVSNLIILLKMKHIYITDSYLALCLVMRFSILDFCDPNPCQNGGSCSSNFGGAVCKCTSSWHGRRCQKGEFLYFSSVCYHVILICSFLFLYKLLYIY